MHGCMMGFCPYLENYHDNGAKKGRHILIAVIQSMLVGLLMSGA